MELKSDKLYNLYNREDEIKKLIEKDNKKIDILNEKFQKLYDARVSINNYLKCGLVIDLVSILNELSIADLAITVLDINNKRVLKEKRKSISKKLLVILKLKREYRDEIISLEEELADIKREIREL